MTEGVERAVEEVLERDIRPLLRSHLGDAAVERVDDDGVVHLRFAGACTACGYRKTTLLTAIYPRLHAIDGVRGVAAAGVPTTRAEEQRVLARLGGGTYGDQRGGRRST